LAKLAIEIAPRGGNGERPTGGKDMKKGLLFYGVYMHCTGVTIDQGIVTTTNILPYFTIPPFSLPHFTAMGAELAAHVTVFKGGIKRGKLAAQVTFLQAHSLRM